MREKVIISSLEKIHDSHIKDLHNEHFCVYVIGDEEGDEVIRYCLIPTSDNHLLICACKKSLSLAVLLEELFQFQVISLTLSVSSAP